MNQPLLRHFWAQSIVLVLFAGACACSQAQIVIDTFDAGPFTLTASAADQAMIQTANSSEIAGGQRQVTLAAESNQFLPHSTASLQAGDGFLAYDREQNAIFGLGYGSYASVPMNLNLSGMTEFRLTLSQAPGTAVLRFFVIDNSFAQNQNSFELPINGPGTYEIPFAQFSGVQFDKIGGIRLEMFFAPDPGIYTFQNFDSFAAVPEPQGYAQVAGLGVIGWGAFRRLRRKSPAA